MQLTKRNTILLGLAGISLVVLAAVVTLMLLKGREDKKQTGGIGSSVSENTNNEGDRAESTESGTDEQDSSRFVWQYTENGWVAAETPPACPDPLVLEAPADLNNVTSILYPGQTRGGNYKSHGGFRFDSVLDNKIDVIAPVSGQLVNGARYLVDGEIQYTFDVIAPCGIMYRLGHLRELSPKFQTVANEFPEAQEGDSRTTFVDPMVPVTQGELIATMVGITADQNTFFDWGVYDLRTKNEISQDSNWARVPGHDNDLAQHAVCWFDLLSPVDEALVRDLPAADSESGRTSDYCE